MGGGSSRSGLKASARRLPMSFHSPPRASAMAPLPRDGSAWTNELKASSMPFPLLIAFSNSAQGSPMKAVETAVDRKRRRQREAAADSARIAALASALLRDELARGCGTTTVMCVQSSGETERNPI
eukprot:6185075-Pleurochrysis_carterae.AAC.2